MRLAWLVVLGMVLRVPAYCEQGAPMLACSNLLSRAAGGLDLLHFGASTPLRSLPNERVQCQSFARFRYQAPCSVQGETDLGRLWHSPFTSFQEFLPTCLRSNRNGDIAANSLVLAVMGDFLDSGLPGAESPWLASTQNLLGSQSKLSTARQQSPKHIFGFVPAYHVSYQAQFHPLTKREKFQEWLRDSYDPGGLALYAAESASLEYSPHTGFCGYGKGLGNYAKCDGSMELDATTASFLGDFGIAVLFHEDPRYFRLGKGSVAGRTFYAISRVFVTHADSGQSVFFAAEVVGAAAAAATSNLYYPPRNRGFGPSVSHFSISLGDTAAFNVAAEFWPEMQRLLNHVF
jgi:hypothetical protein